jgi:hypothetical protein
MEDPGESQGVYVCGVDLVEGAEALSGVVAVVGGPGVGRGLGESSRIEFLRCDAWSVCANVEEQKNDEGERMKRNKTINPLRVFIATAPAFDFSTQLGEH